MKHFILISLSLSGTKAFAQVVNDSLGSSPNLSKFRISKDSSAVKMDKDSVVNENRQKIDSTKDATHEKLSNKKDSLRNSVQDKIPNQDSLKSNISGKISENKDSLKTVAKDKIAGQKDAISGQVKDQISGKKELFKGKIKNMLHLPDTSGFKKRLRSFDLQGSIASGYEYGILPCVVGSNFPIGGAKVEGAVSFSVATLPLDLTFHYTTIRNVVGLNNYFRLSFNSHRYKEQLIQKLSFKNKLSIDQLGKLQIQQQGLLKKLEYLKFLQKYPNYKVPGLDTAGMKQKGIDSLKGSLDDPRWQEKRDSLLSFYKDNRAKYDSVKTFYEAFKEDPKVLAEKLAKEKSAVVMDSAQHYMQKKDSIVAEAAVWRARYDSIQGLISEVKARLEQIKLLLSDPGAFASPYLSRVELFLSHIKKFEIGLCNPSYSTFLINNTPLQGLNFEYVKNNNFIGFTYGTTVNNLLFNTQTMQGMMQGVRNLYNYFDFGNLSSGRKVLSLKGGLGTPESTHLLVGFALGKGRTDYLMVIPDAPPSSYSKESNLVLELDARYKFSERVSLDVILGKSSVKDGDLNFPQIKNTLNEALSNYRSYALLTRVNWSIAKTGTNLTFTTRWIDPYFKSFGVGFLRSDNLRFEVKAEQPITKRIKYTATYRRDSDNLLHLYDYKNTLQSLNNALNMKLSRQLNIRFNYAPLFRELRSSEMVIRDVNHIFGTIVSYTPRAKKVVSQFNFMYCKNLITTDSANANFENFTYTHQFQFPSRIKTGMNLSWFKNSLTDTLNNDTYTAMLDIGYSTRKKSSFSIGGKMAYKKGLEIQYGFVAKASIKVYKGLFWETEAERITIGDYYNSFNIDQIKRFPYYGSTKLILNF